MALDVLRELTGEGIDTVKASITYTLAAATPTLEIENITLVGLTNINAFGNGLANVLTGNDVNNTLDGGTGVDTLIGGLGDDLFVVDVAGDIVTEASGEGTDTILSSITFNMAVDGADADAVNDGDNVENLTLAGAAAINGTGNTLGNAITGNGNDNVLDGGNGADKLFGNFGIDTLIGGVAGDGADKDTLDGGGADFMTGSDGDDLYLVDNTGDTHHRAFERRRRPGRRLHYRGPDLCAERECGTPEAAWRGQQQRHRKRLDNSITGSDGVNTLTGLAGSDTYVVTAGDVVVEAVGEGTLDTIRSASSWVIDSLQEIEALTLTGSAVINGTGNGLANTITGNSAANTLDGLGGADSLVGLGGNDTYVVDNVLDIADESGGGGVDTVLASVDYDMGAQTIARSTT